MLFFDGESSLNVSILIIKIKLQVTENIIIIKTLGNIILRSFGSFWAKGKRA